jgi:hypothetical protein
MVRPLRLAPNSDLGFENYIFRNCDSTGIDSSKWVALIARSNVGSAVTAKTSNNTCSGPRYAELLDVLCSFVNAEAVFRQNERSDAISSADRLALGANANDLVGCG